MFEAKTCDWIVLALLQRYLAHLQQSTALLQLHPVFLIVVDCPASRLPASLPWDILLPRACFHRAEKRC